MYTLGFIINILYVTTWVIVASWRIHKLEVNDTLGLTLNSLIGILPTWQRERIGKYGYRKIVL